MAGRHCATGSAQSFVSWRAAGVARLGLIGLGEPLEYGPEFGSCCFLRTQPGLHGTLAIRLRVIFHYATPPPENFPARHPDVNVTTVTFHSRSCSVADDCPLNDLRGLFG